MATEGPAIARRLSSRATTPKAISIQDAGSGVVTDADVTEADVGIELKLSDRPKINVINVPEKPEEEQFGIAT